MFADAKREVAIANRVLAATGLAAGVTAALGHASLRAHDQPDRFIVKGRGYAMDALSAMRPEDMVVCDLDGAFVEGPPSATQCFEVMLHACIFRARPDVRSVVHVHPRFTVLMSTLGIGLRPMCQEGLELVREPLPVYPHEIAERPPLAELPHFVEPFARVKGQPRVGGVWQYYTALVSADL